MTKQEAINDLLEWIEQILREDREERVTDDNCGACEYDGAYLGASGDWCNECPGFERDDCFVLSEEILVKYGYTGNKIRRKLT